MSIFKNFLKKGVNAGLAVGRVIEAPFRAIFGPPSAEKFAKKQVGSTFLQKCFDSKIGKLLSYVFRPKYFYQGLEDIIRTKEIDISVKFVGTVDTGRKDKTALDPCNNPVFEGVLPTVRRQFEVTVNNKGYGLIDKLTIKLFTLPSYPEDQSGLPLPDSIIIGDMDTPPSFPPGFSKVLYTCNKDIFLGASESPLVAKKMSHVFVNMIDVTGFPKSSGARPSTQTVTKNVPNALGGQMSYLSPQGLFTLNNYAWSRIEAKSQRIRIVQWVGRFATIAALIIAGFKGIGHWSDHQDLMRRQTGPNGVFMPMKEPPKTIKDLEVEQKRAREEMAEKHRKEESSLLWRMQHPGQAEKNEAARQKAVKAREEAGNNERQKDNESASELFKQAAPSGTKQEVSAPNSGAIDKSALQKSADYSAPNRNGPGYGGKNVIRTNGKTSQYSI
ncbi:MAG: hypothetical protein EOM37_00515 [Proteobacteria bacterium]|nr:hypothetical protein [Pseudomonadota bacterium]